MTSSSLRISKTQFAPHRDVTRQGEEAESRAVSRVCVCVCVCRGKGVEKGALPGAGGNGGEP